MSDRDDMDPFRAESYDGTERSASEVISTPDSSTPIARADNSAGTSTQRTTSMQQAQKEHVLPPTRLRDDMSKANLIQIVDALKTTEGSSTAYIAYVVRSQYGDARRRYSEFEALRGILSKLYPVLIIPPIPPHHSLGDYAVKQSKAKEDANVIARRRRMLTMFLNRCNRHPLLGHDRVFLRFLDPQTAWSEIVHSPPVTLLPKNSLKAPSHDPTDATLAQLYSSLPNVSTTQPLQEPDQRFQDSEQFTSRFSAHLSGNVEKVNRRLMKRWSELGADYVELGGLLNGFGLTETHPVLSAAIERTGTAVDNTYVHTNAMLQDWERTFTEPLAEYSQFSAIIKNLLRFRHLKHLQYEMARDVLESKRYNLEELERTEAEARRLDQALERVSRRSRPAEMNTAEEGFDGNNDTPASETNGVPVSVQQSTATNAPIGRHRSGASGLLGALQHTFHGIIDSDPEATRRNSIGRTRDSIGQLEEALRLTTADLRHSSQTIQADLDRFQRQKVGDLREMCLTFARWHQQWAEKNLDQWQNAKSEIVRLVEEI